MAAPRPTPAFIARAVEGAAKGTGREPVGVEVRQDGSVLVLFVAKGATAPVASPLGGGGLVDCEAIFAAGRGS